jgi:hypothetical protein
VSCPPSVNVVAKNSSRLPLVGGVDTAGLDVVPNGVGTREPAGAAAGA